MRRHTLSSDRRVSSSLPRVHATTHPAAYTRTAIGRQQLGEFVYPSPSWHLGQEEGSSARSMADGSDRDSSKKPKPPPSPPAGEDAGEGEGPVAADKALHALGFEFTHIGEREVAGRLPVTDTCCQPFGVLNGGVSALVAESTASVGAYMASGYRRVACVQLSVNHLRPARLGDVVRAQAAPVQLGRTIQVWEVRIWRADPSTEECKDLVSTARVTMLIANPSRPDEMSTHEASIKKYAKL